MSDTFVHPPFDRPDVLARVLDRVPAGTPATVEGHALASDEHGLRVALVEAAETGVPGALMRLGPDDRARLDFAMAALGASPEPVTVRTGSLGAEARAEARAYRFGPDCAPGAAADATTTERLARLGETLAEVMGHFGRRAPSEMPALLSGIAIRALGRSRGAAGSAPSAIGSGMSSADVEPVERVQAYASYFAIEEHRLRHRRFDGTMSEVLGRAVFTSGDAVVVLPYDPRRDAVVMIEQFRAGPWARLDPHPWCLETVAGRCDRSETPEATARREAREEAGLELGRVETIAGYYPSPAIMSEYLTSFVGEADLGAAGGVFGLAEEHEDIRVHVVSRAAALAAVASGEIRSAPLILSLLWLDRNAARLQAAWRVDPTEPAPVGAKSRTP